MRVYISLDIYEKERTLFFPGMLKPPTMKERERERAKVEVKRKKTANMPTTCTHII